MKIRNAVVAALAVSICLVPSMGALAAEEAPGGAPGPNLLVSLTLGEVSKGPQRNYRVVARAGESARMLVGWRTPIPTARTAEKDQPQDQMDFYVYQNVGMSAELRPQLLPDGRVRLSGQIEISGSRESEMKETPLGMPVIGTFQQDLDVLLKMDQALRVAEVPDPEGGQRFLEITVKRMD